MRRNCLFFEGVLLPAIANNLATTALPEFLQRPVNDERGLRIRLFRFLFDSFSHFDSL